MTMNTSMKAGFGVAALLAAGLVTMLAAPPAAGQTYKSEYKISTVLGAPFPWGLSAQRWADLVKERSDGRIVMKVYPGAQLVGGDQTKRIHLDAPGRHRHGGRLDHQLVAAGRRAQPVRAAVPDAGLSRRSTPSPAARPARSCSTIARGARTWCRSPGARTASARCPTPSASSRTPDDLKGLKIRVVGSPLFNETFTALGANPTQMSWADAAAGPVDRRRRRAGEPAVGLYRRQAAHGGQKHLTLWDYVADPLIFAVSQAGVDHLLGADQKIVRETAIEAGKYGKELARKGITGRGPRRC